MLRNHWVMAFVVWSPKYGSDISVPWGIHSFRNHLICMKLVDFHTSRFVEKKTKCISQDLHQISWKPLQWLVSHPHASDSLVQFGIWYSHGHNGPQGQTFCHQLGVPLPQYYLQLPTMHGHKNIVTDSIFTIKEILSRSALPDGFFQ